MIYTKMTNKAIMLMFEAHKEQLDKSGLPYVFHPWHVAESMQDEKRCTVALLHDIIEDTDVTLDILKKNNFPDDVIEAINVLTKKDDEDYAEYIRKIAENELAIDVKIADLKHNLDKSRSNGQDIIPKIKYEIYENSLNFLIRTKRLNSYKNYLISSNSKH